jgi:transcriptional regulator with XRE-family HTH domain
VVDQDEPWAKRISAEIGRRVAFHRERLDLSAQQLAGRCAELGMPSVSRVVITKLENGRREAVSTAELQVLARALDVPPVLLLFPLGQAETVEVLPGLNVDPYAAIEWFSGRSSDPADWRAVSQALVMGELAMWNEHLRYEEQIADADRAFREAQDLIIAEDRDIPYREHVLDMERAVHSMGTAELALRRVRLNMRERGLTPPPLSPLAAQLVNRELGGEGSDGSR